MDNFLKDTIFSFLKEINVEESINEEVVDQYIQLIRAHYEIDRVRELLKERENTKETLRIAKTGIWSLIIRDGEEPCFYGDETLSDLIGIPVDVSPQERYVRHREFIEQEDMDVFLEYSNNLVNKGRAEVVYRYNHPTKGLTFAISVIPRTPINGILGMTEIAKDQISDPRALKETITKIETAGKHLLSLVNDVLDMSRLESDEIKVVNAPFNMVALLQEVEQIAEVNARKNGIHLQLLGTERIKYPELIGSPALLKRIFLNLISNGIQYNRPNGEVNVLIKETEVKDDKVTFEIKVEDTGIGMDPEFVPHVFEAFTQEKESARTQYKGTGLGMSIVKNIVDQLGGDISVISIKNVGTSFNVILSFEISKQKKENEVLSIQEIEDYSFTGKRVLIVDDNSMNLQITEYIAKRLEMLSDCVENGKEALDAFVRSIPGTYDVIFMDIMMPVMNGIDAAKAIRLTNHPQARSIPIIAMSANAFEEDKNASKEAGMNGHVAKPVNIQVLKETMVRCQV